MTAGRLRSRSDHESLIQCLLSRVCHQDNKINHCWCLRLEIVLTIIWLSSLTRSQYWFRLWILAACKPNLLKWNYLSISITNWRYIPLPLWWWCPSVFQTYEVRAWLFPFFWLDLLDHKYVITPLFRCSRSACFFCMFVLDPWLSRIAPLILSVTTLSVSSLLFLRTRWWLYIIIRSWYCIWCIPIIGCCGVWTCLVQYFRFELLSWYMS